MKSLQELVLSHCPELRTIPAEVFRIDEVDTFGTPAHQVRRHHLPKDVRTPRWRQGGGRCETALRSIPISPDVEEC